MPAWKNVKNRIILILVVAIGVIVIVSTSGFCAEKGDSPNYNKASTETSMESLPGIEMFDKELLNKFEEMRKIRGPAYKPRTRHLRPDEGAKFTNRLFLESSPYLLQHAHNPVNWYPWGDESFETAKKLNRPVLLSVGYSTCHWCHVMEEESFEDEEIARYLNENYIAIKVDREERPDVDAIYMTAVQAMTGQGGWPMTVWLTPERKPFFGGTYFPARDGDRGANIGFLTLLKRAKEGYHTRKDLIAKSSQRLTKAIQEVLAPESGNSLPAGYILHAAINYYSNSFDGKHGGLNGAPKFPSSLPVRLMLRYYLRTGKKEILEMADITLKKMAGGGMYDHVGGGFHRYSTDERWLVPHFEKMLYDNALLIMTYLEGYQATGEEDFKGVAKEILRYVKRDMTSPEGAFYSATDADSLNPKGHQDEGFFFTWTPQELERALGKDRAGVVMKYYAVSAPGNFEGRTILNTPQTAAKIAESMGISEKELRAVIKESKEILYQVRSLRPPPLRDEKILTAWNGLMISAHAKAGLILGDSRYTERAVKAARFILTQLYRGNRLLRSYKDNKAKYNAYLDDYAFLIAALLDLYEATHDIQWLEKAIEMDTVLEKNYEDKKKGGFFMTSNDSDDLIAREKPNHDGALPSGNSVTLLNLLRLAEFTTGESYRKRAEKALMSFSATLTSNPIARSVMLLAVDFFLARPKESGGVAPNGKKS